MKNKNKYRKRKEEPNNKNCKYHDMQKEDVQRRVWKISTVGNRYVFFFIIIIIIIFVMVGERMRWNVNIFVAVVTKSRHAFELCIHQVIRISKTTWRQSNMGTESISCQGLQES